MKVAISLPDSLFEAAERLAKERHVARSRIFADALDEYLSRHDQQAVTNQLNKVYAEQDSGADRALMHAQMSAIEDEAW